jgi:hypothetical protein
VPLDNNRVFTASTMSILQDSLRFIIVTILSTKRIKLVDYSHKIIVLFVMLNRDITEILLKVVLNTTQQTNKQTSIVIENIRVNIIKHNVFSNGSCKSNYHTITATTAPR